MAPRKRKLKKWTTRADNQIIALRAQGLSNAKIGEKIGRSANSEDSAAPTCASRVLISPRVLRKTTKETAPAAVEVAKKVLTQENFNKTDPSTPLTEMATSLAKLTAYVSMLEAQTLPYCVRSMKFKRLSESDWVSTR